MPFLRYLDNLYLPILYRSTPWIKGIYFPRWKISLIYRFMFPIYEYKVQFILNFSNVSDAIHNLVQLVGFTY